MNETINLMKAHTSVRRFTEEQISDEELRAIIDAGRAASSWKNFQSYSIIVVRSKEKKEALFELVPQEAIRQSSAFLLFVGDLNRAQKGVQLHTDGFYPKGTENLLISSVDAALAGQNTLLAAESLGYGGVIIGLVRYEASKIAQLFNLPDYTYPVFGMALESLIKTMLSSHVCLMKRWSLRKNTVNNSVLSLRLMTVYRLSMLVIGHRILGASVWQPNLVRSRIKRLTNCSKKRN